MKKRVPVWVRLVALAGGVAIAILVYLNVGEGHLPHWTSDAVGSSHWLERLVFAAGVGLGVFVAALVLLVMVFGDIKRVGTSLLEVELADDLQATQADLLKKMRELTRLVRDLAKQVDEVAPRKKQNPKRRVFKKGVTDG